MKRRHSLLMGMLLVLTTVPLTAQNYLFQNGQSGFHLKGLYFNKEFPFNEINVEIGYTIKSRLYLNLNYIQWDPTFNSSDGKIHFAGGGLDYLLIRQDKFPVSISLGISYMYSRNIYEVT